MVDHYRIIRYALVALCVLVVYHYVSITPNMELVKQSRCDQSENSVQSELSVQTKQSSGGPENFLISQGMELPFKPRLANHVITEYNVSLRKEFQRLCDLKVKQDDADLLVVIREMLDEPRPFGVTQKLSRRPYKTPQLDVIEEILKNQTKGFFIEAGAFDGEHSSNTLWLESARRWTGLLIEPDPYYYTQVMGKARRAWGINACISPYPYPTMMDFKESPGMNGELFDKNIPVKNSHHKGRMRQVPCLPLKSLLLALKRTTVDFFSLDVQGFELEVLKTVPLEEFNFRTLAVEYSNGQGEKQALANYMVSKGYTIHKDISVHDYKVRHLYIDDFIFVKNDTSVGAWD